MSALRQVALQVLIRGLSLATLPVVCRLLGPEAYAAVVALVALHLLATAVAAFGVHGIIARLLASAPAAGGERLGAAVVVLVPATLVAGLGVACAGWAGLLPWAAVPWLLMALLSQAPASLAAGLLQIRPHQRGLIAHQGASALVSAACPLAALLVLGATPVAYATGMALAGLMMLPWHVAVIRQASPSRPGWTDVTTLLGQASPLVVGVLAGWACDWLDRVLLGWWHPTPASGGYALGAGIAIGVMGAVQSGLMVVWTPAHHRQPQATGPDTRRYVGLVVLAWLTLVLGSPLIGPLLGGAGFEGALWGACLIGTAQALAALNGLQVQHLLLQVDTRSIMAATVTGGVVSVVAGVALIPSGGLGGAGVAQILGHLAAGVVLWQRSRGIPHHPWRQVFGRHP